MLRVLQIIGGMDRAGAETMLMNIYRTIDREQMQFDFVVYTDLRQDYEAEIERLGGRVIHIPCHRGLSMIKTIWSIRSIIDRYGPYCAIHAHTLHNCAYAMLAARKYPQMVRLSHSHCTQNGVRQSWLKRLYEQLSRHLIRKYSTQWLACGEEAGQYLFGERFAERGKVIHNSVDPDIFFSKDEQAYKRLASRYRVDGGLVIGSIARLDPVKNHCFMLEIAHAMKRRGIAFNMLLVGQGALEAQLKEQIERLGLNGQVHLLGMREDIPDLLHFFDVFLMPSLFEGNPVTLIEAQASGLPCVVSDNITPLIDMELGLIHRCSLDSPPEQWIDQILASAGNRLTDGNAIRAALEQHGYDLKTNATLLCTLYQSNLSTEQTR